MPASFLSAAERERLNSFPGEIGELDVATALCDLVGLQFSTE